jgi:hypothetical protein
MKPRVKRGVNSWLTEWLLNRLLPFAALPLLSVFSAAVAGGCRGGDPTRRASTAGVDSAAIAVPATSVTTPAGVPVGAESNSRMLDRVSPPLAGLAPDAAGIGAASVPDGGVGGDVRVPESLRIEEHEPDPRSETVTIKVQVDSPKGARVYWGPKDLGLTPLEIARPRSSGPLDLILRASGYLTVHTRAYTDRNDRIAVHLIPETDAPRMLGYRPR